MDGGCKFAFEVKCRGDGRDNQLGVKKVGFRIGRCYGTNRFMHVDSSNV